jgi:N-acetylglutamate synthase-like GNAT family acetyltransferase
MNIRNATYHDAPAIKLLLEALGHKTSNSLLVNQLETIFSNGDNQVFVYELRKEVVGFASVHYLPQLAFDEGVIIISNFSVDESVQYTDVAKQLDEYIEKYARLRKCKLIQVHYMGWRTDAHLFYLQQGYQEYPQYFTKRLVYGG